MISRKCHVSGIQIWAGNPGARDHIELQSCQDGKNTKKYAQRKPVQEEYKIPKLTIIVPF